ncbi:adenylyltransferase and sulfurtransferase MOCS3 isoform X2 [Zophobas morio]|uniref:adenylyltransferase and sulfurtransferase MOCS3 isoform X2 n=1 Tax=Zophobas morio TaxID=2755281 RepID=UPI00308383B2
MSITEIKDLEQEIIKLEDILRTKKALLHQLKTNNEWKCPYSDYLSTQEVVKYSRQMIMPQVSKLGQVILKKSRILIIGAGGLGCPASLYLASAGVGEIHIADYDDVELSNLHRQVLHFEEDVGRPKVDSVYNKLNSDNAPTRYLLNDVCVFHNIPLVSGSALQMEGQLTVYHYKNGPCYRCLFPIPPPTHTVTNCGDGGVLGPVAGIIGVLQALEAIKIILNVDGVLSGRMLLFDGVETTFRNVRLRQKMTNCDVCGENPTITSPVDYEHFCGSKANDKVIDVDILEHANNIDIQKLPHILKEKYVVIDVRPELEYSMCNIPGTINLPYSIITTDKGIANLQELIKKDPDTYRHVYMLCRRGNDSQRSVDFLQKNFPDTSVKFFNVKGGLYAYSKEIDPLFPVY